MNLRQLRYFVGVVESGNMTRAAERLHVGQTALGRRSASSRRIWVSLCWYATRVASSRRPATFCTSARSRSEAGRGNAERRVGVRA